MRSTVSILGIYNYDNTVLDDWSLPDSVSRETFNGNLFRECAELELLYSDPDVLKEMLKTWSANRLRVWNELAATLEYEYNAIENYDRREDWTDNNDANSESTGSSNVGTSGNSQTDVNVAAFNAGDLKQRDKTTTKATGSTNSTDTTMTNAQNTATHTGRMHGNIGVTTTQQMIREQREIVQFSIIEFIIQDFKDNFCLMVY